MASDKFDNEAADRAMLRKLQDDQEDTMDNDEQRDYAEEQYNRHLLDDETDPDEDQESERDTPRLNALLREDLNLVLPRIEHQITLTWDEMAAIRRLRAAVSSTWRQRAEEAEAALTAIGGILANPGYPDPIGDIERILRTSGKQAKRFTAHTGMLAHDGFMPHSHEVRPDHYSVPREKP